ncbi:hypothetical protein CAOG_010063 [Capsaspora owczarzaki ATCC 30864]|uniref:PSI domain-containing protein n=1 Tax=Capsaspora owczarzaki (strain ATCC 30864) TaxID=595528 RepID=A0A0D2UPE7_CAPO3|nr:hypothetical protein CAOG_010063 [Capsaspora owczarzaki ATCC 30864]
MSRSSSIALFVLSIVIAFGIASASSSLDPCLNGYGSTTALISNCSTCIDLSGCLWCASPSLTSGNSKYISPEGLCISGDWRGLGEQVCFSCSDWRYGECAISSVVLYGLCGGAVALVLIAITITVICVRRRRRSTAYMIIQ